MPWPLQSVCTGGDSCCTEEYPCGEGEGDCDNDDHCEGDLVCGKNNCVGDTFEDADDCCVVTLECGPTFETRLSQC